MKKNVQSQLASQLQQLSVTFRKSQRDYLQSTLPFIFSLFNFSTFNWYHLYTLGVTIISPLLFIRYL